MKIREPADFVSRYFVGCSITRQIKPTKAGNESGNYCKMDQFGCLQIFIFSLH